MLRIRVLTPFTIADATAGQRIALDATARAGEKHICEVAFLTERYRPQRGVVFDHACRQQPPLLLAHLDRLAPDDRKLLPDALGVSCCSPA